MVSRLLKTYKFCTIPNLNYYIMQSVLVAVIDNFFGLSTNSKRNISSTIASVFKQCLI